MCFSATASFLTAAVTGAAGIAALQRTTDARERPLAAIPLLFSVQQAVEGALWLMLPVAPQSQTCAVLTHTFLIFALIVWPVFAPLAALAIEREPWRRKAIMACTLVGAGGALLLEVQQDNDARGGGEEAPHRHEGVPIGEPRDE